MEIRRYKMNVPEQVITEKHFLKLFKQHLKIVRKLKLTTKEEIDRNIFYGLCPFREGIWISLKNLSPKSYSVARQYYITHRELDNGWELRQEMRVILEEIKWK
jgi:hypothetical protein